MVILPNRISMRCARDGDSLLGVWSRGRLRRDRMDRYKVLQSMVAKVLLGLGCQPMMMRWRWTDP